MTIELIYRNIRGKHEFYNIKVEGNALIITSGILSQNSTITTKVFKDEEAALKVAEGIVKGKKRKGFVEATAQNELVVRNDYTFARKSIWEFATTLNPATAVKVVTEYDEEETMAVILQRMAQLPNVAEVDTLVLGLWKEAYSVGPDWALAELIKWKEAFSGLRHLFVGDISREECEMSWIQQTDYSEFYQHFPALETFGVRGGTALKLGRINLPNLKNLIVETGGMDKQVVADIVQSNLTTLEHLELWLGTDEYGGSVTMEDLKPILYGNYPNLKYLGLKNYDEEDQLVQHLNGATIINNLEELDLSMGVLKDSGAKALYENEALLNLKQLNCRHHYISDEWVAKLKEKFIAQNINLEDARKSNYTFVEIGE